MCKNSYLRKSYRVSQKRDVSRRSAAVYFFVIAYRHVDGTNVSVFTRFRTKRKRSTFSTRILHGPPANATLLLSLRHWICRRHNHKSISHVYYTSRTVITTYSRQESLARRSRDTFSPRTRAIRETTISLNLRRRRRAPASASYGGRVVISDAARYSSSITTRAPSRPGRFDDVARRPQCCSACKTISRRSPKSYRRRGVFHALSPRVRGRHREATRFDGRTSGRETTAAGSFRIQTFFLPSSNVRHDIRS